MKKNTLQEKSYNFALRVVKLSQYLNLKKHEFHLSKKVLDSGTAVGMLVEEARQGYDHLDFTMKFSAANKEAFKTNFLIRILRDAGYLDDAQAQSMISDCEEIQRMLIASLKTARKSE